MRARYETSFVHRYSRAAIAIAFLAAVSLPAVAGALPPAVDTGGPGGGGDIAEMLRGNYSPIDMSDDIAVTERSSEMTAAEMLRGDYSPIA